MAKGPGGKESVLAEGSAAELAASRKFVASCRALDAKVKAVAGFQEHCLRVEGMTGCYAVSPLEFWPGGVLFPVPASVDVMRLDSDAAVKMQVAPMLGGLSAALKPTVRMLLVLLLLLLVLTPPSSSRSRRPRSAAASR